MRVGIRVRFECLQTIEQSRRGFEETFRDAQEIWSTINWTFMLNMNLGSLGDTSVCSREEGKALKG